MCIPPKDLVKTGFCWKLKRAGGDEGIRKLDALWEVNFDKRSEAVVGPNKDVQGKISNRFIAYNAERKSVKWHTDGKHPKKIGEMLRFNERTKRSEHDGHQG